MKHLRIVFMGSPYFAVPTLQALADHYIIVGVVTQPDRPSGRGRQLQPPPVKSLAETLNIPCIQPERLRRPEAMEQLRTWTPDLIVVAAFGQILRAEVLELPSLGCINVHASLLPRWRGAAPIQAALMQGDTRTGITIMCMDAGIDTGAMLSQADLEIDPQDTSATLSTRLSDLGASLLIDTLPSYLSGEITPQIQNEAQACYAPMLKKEDGLLDFSRPAEQLANQVRAYNPWPGAFTILQEQPLKIHRAQAMHFKHSKAAGTQAVIEQLPAISTPDGWLVLLEVQPAGKKPMSGKEFLHGWRGWAA